MPFYLAAFQAERLVKPHFVLIRIAQEEIVQDVVCYILFKPTALHLFRACSLTIPVLIMTLHQ
jgi:hypothetical protein